MRWLLCLFMCVCVVIKRLAESLACRHQIIVIDMARKSPYLIAKVVRVCVCFSAYQNCRP